MRLTSVHVEGPVSLQRGPEPGAGGGQGLRHADRPVVALARLLVHEAPVLAFVAVHVLAVHLRHQVVLGALGPGGQALQLLRGALRPLHVDAGLEVELEPVVVRAAVQVGLGVAALVQPGPALGVAEEEGALEGALDGLGVPPEHGVHGRVPRDVVTQRLERVEVCLTVTCTQ